MRWNDSAAPELMERQRPTSWSRRNKKSR